MSRKILDSTALYAFDAEQRAAHGRICGVDEAGRGPLCGPVCCAAVILDPENQVEGVNDSKSSAKSAGKPSMRRSLPRRWPGR